MSCGTNDVFRYVREGYIRFIGSCYRLVAVGSLVLLMQIVFNWAC